MCRKPAADLHAKKDELNKNGVRLVAIVKENLDTEIDDFKARAWPEADLFMDESKLMYKIAHGGSFTKVTAGGICKYICNIFCCNKRRFRNAKAAQDDYGMNYKGEGAIYGSILVVDGSGRIVYSHAEKAMDDHPDVADVVSAATNPTTNLPDIPGRV